MTDTLYTDQERAADAARADPLDRIKSLTHGRVRLSELEEWIGEEFARIERELANLRAIRRDKRQPKIWLETPSEVFKAVELGLIAKPEGRAMLGLKKVKQPPQLRRKP